MLRATVGVVARPRRRSGGARCRLGARRSTPAPVTRRRESSPAGRAPTCSAPRSSSPLARPRTWRIVADVGTGPADVAELRRRAAADPRWRRRRCRLDTAAACDRCPARADHGWRQTPSSAPAIPSRAPTTYANVTYNVMRGGVPLAGYRIDTADFAAFVEPRNRTVAERHAGWFGESAGDARATRARRTHRRASTTSTSPGSDGSTCRSASRAGTATRAARGTGSRSGSATTTATPVIHFEGNWRDVFQNWEALCVVVPRVPARRGDACSSTRRRPTGTTPTGSRRERHRLGGPRSGGPVVQHRLLGRSPDRLPAAAARGHRPIPARGDRPAARRAVLHVRRRAVPDRAYDDLVRDPKATIEFDDEAHAPSRASASPRWARTASSSSAPTASSSS